MFCKNCGASFEGNFCNHCGQSATVKPINFQYLIHEIQNSLFQLNRGFFYTLKELIIHPGYTIREYFEGKRKQHFKPLAFVFILSTIYAILNTFTEKNTFIQDALTGFISGKAGNVSTKSYTLLGWLADHFSYATLLLIPLFSLASYLAFLKSKYNFFEHLILNFFLSGLQVFFYLFFTFIFHLLKIEEDLVQTLAFFISVFYTFFTFLQLFKHKKFYITTLLLLLTYFLYLLFILIVMFSLMAINKHIKI